MLSEVKERLEQVRKGATPQGYKHTVLGIVPQEWEEFSLGEIYSERKQAGDPSLPVLSVSIHTGVSDGELDEESLGKKVKRIEDKTQYRTALEGDLVFNMMRAWQGAIGVVRSRGLVSPAYIVAKPSDQVYPPFMDYYMQTPRMINLIQRMSYGVTDFRLRLYWDSFEQIPCVLPPLHEQKRIVEILKVQDTIIDLGQQRIEQIKRMKKALLKKMFLQKESRLPEIRFPGFTAPWEQSRFVDLCDYASEGGTPDTKNPTFYKGGKIPFVKIEDTSEKYIDSPKSFITEEGMKHSSAWLVPKDSVIFTNGATIGNVAINKIPVATKQGILGIIPSQNVTSEFMYYLLSSDGFQREVHSRMATGTFATIILKNLNEIPVCYPTNSREQDTISSILSGIDNLITLHQRALEAEQKKKKALMQRLLTGLVRIKV